MAAVPEDQINVYWQVAFARFKSQEALLSEFGGRVLGMLTVSIALLAAGFLFLSTVEDPSLPVTVAFTLSGLFPIAAIILACVFILPPSDWRSGPKPSDLADFLYNYEDRAIAQWAADRYSESVEYNRTTLERKAKVILWMAILLALQSSALAVAGVLSAIL